MKTQNYGQFLTYFTLVPHLFQHFKCFDFQYPSPVINADFTFNSVNFTLGVITAKQS